MIDKVGETRHYGAMEEICKDAKKQSGSLQTLLLAKQGMMETSRSRELTNRVQSQLEVLLAAQPLNPLRPLEFRVLPINELCLTQNTKI